MLAVHASLSTTLLILLVICLLWSVYGIVTGTGISPSLRSTQVLTLAAAVGQLVVGFVMVAMGRPFSGIHALYGVSVVVALGAAIVFGNRTTRPREALIYAVVNLFTTGLLLRAMETVGRLD